MALKRPVPFADIDLIVQISGSAMRWALGEGSEVEVWRGLQLLGTLSGETLRQLVAQHLSTAALVLQVQQALTRPEADRPRTPTLPMLRKPPSKDISPEVKAQRRAARRHRVGRKRATPPS